jgi:hypothetical protein
MFRKITITFFVSLLLLASCMSLPDLSGEVTAEETESAELAVDGALPIEINNFAGTITVREGDPGQIAATVVKESRLANEADAQAQLDEINLIVEETATGARVEAEGPDNADNLEDVEFGLTARLEVTVPPGSDLTLNLGAGEITLDQPTGDASVNSGAGAATAILPADASFNVHVTGGVAGIDSEFEGVPDGGIATDVEATIGDNPTQTLTFNLGAGEVKLQKAP